jgi:SynChlorMet cassette protein ScmC
LKLANGRVWRFIADRDSEWLCEDLARLAELDAASLVPCETIALVSGGRELLSAEVLEKVRKLSGAIALPGCGWVRNNHRVLEFWSQPGIPFAITSPLIHQDPMMNILQVRQTLYPVMAGEIAAGGLPVHAALVERDGEGVLIAAKAGTGKSTCCQRIPPPWHGLCDDEALIVKTGEVDYRVHPFLTWSEYTGGPAKRTWHVERHVRLAAIFFLEQADIDAAVPCPKGMAAASLYFSGVEAFWKYDLGMDAARVAEFRARMLDNACQIARTTPAFVLKANLTGRFWDAIEGALSSREARLSGTTLERPPSSTPTVKPKRLNIL